jgi:hypothetical protein
MQSPSKKTKIEDTSALIQRLNEIDQKLIESTINLRTSYSSNGDDSDDDSIGDMNSPWSKYILNIAREIDTLRQEKFELARELKANGINVEPIDDGY